MQKKSIIYSQPNCAACIVAKTKLASKGYEIEERVLGAGWTKQDLLVDFPKARSVPQIIADGMHIGSIGMLLEYLGKED